MRLETLAARIVALFLDQTMLVWADPARVRTVAKFSQVAPVELLVTHVAFSAGRRFNLWATREALVYALVYNICFSLSDLLHSVK